jgi:hypothetical protein
VKAKHHVSLARALVDIVHLETGGIVEVWCEREAAVESVVGMGHGEFLSKSLARGVQQAVSNEASCGIGISAHISFILKPVDLYQTWFYYATIKFAHVYASLSRKREIHNGQANQPQRG